MILPSDEWYIYKALQKKIYSISIEYLYSSKEDIPEIKSKFREEGKAEVRRMRRIIERYCKDSYYCKFEGYNVVCSIIFNPNYTQDISSEILRCKSCDMVAIFWYSGGQGRKCNIYLKIGNRKDINVGIICKKYGGYGNEKSGKFSIFCNREKYFY
jgi:hypothetical protein